MDICSTQIETNYYDSDESDCEFMESVQLQLTKSGWYDDYCPLHYYTNFVVRL